MSNTTTSPNLDAIVEKVINASVADPFVLKKGGLFYKKNKKNNNGEHEEELEWLSSPISPVAHIRDIEGKDHSILFIANDGERNHDLFLPRKTMARWGELSDILLSIGLDISLYPDKQKLLQTYLLKVKPSKKMILVDKAGWHGNRYILPSGEVLGTVKFGEEGIYVKAEKHIKGIGEKGSVSSWQSNVLPLCVDNTRLIFSLGVAFSSLCVGLIEGESCIYNLKGPSSKGKSKCLRVGISVLGSPEYMQNWRATDNGLEGLCCARHHTLLALDEMGQFDGKDLGAVAYMIANGSGKERSKSDTTARPAKTWTTTVLSTAEVGLESHMLSSGKKVKAGQLIRALDVPAIVENGNGCFDNIHDSLNGREFADKIDRACADHYGLAGRAFIEFIVAGNIEEHKQYLKIEIKNFVDQFAKDCDGQVMRAASKFGLICASLKLAARSGVLGDYFTDDMINNSIVSCFQSWLENRGTSGDSETQKLVEQVKGLLNENMEGKFLEINAKDPCDKAGVKTLWGYKKGTTYYIFPRAFTNYICKDFELHQAIEILTKEGLLIPGRTTSSKTHRFPAHPIKPDRFYEIKFKGEGETKGESS